MGQSLGAFGAQHDEIDASFEYFGIIVRVHPDMSDLIMLEFMDKLGSIDEEDVAAGFQAMRNLLTGVIHPDDYDTFWRTARANRQTVKDLMEVAAAVIGSAADRPTERPSASSDGPVNVDTKSVDDSSLRVQHRLEESGRADLALVVQQARMVS
jgi:hypothetical protein